MAQTMTANTIDVDQLTLYNNEYLYPQRISCSIPLVGQKYLIHSHTEIFQQYPPEIYFKDMFSLPTPYFSEGPALPIIPTKKDCLVTHVRSSPIKLQKRKQKSVESEEDSDEDDSREKKKKKRKRKREQEASDSEDSSSKRKKRKKTPTKD